MTVQLSPHKVKKILRGYFAGVPQISIARGAEVDQATVSHYATRFRKTAARMGIIAAAKEYGVLNEVDGLRSLSVELNKSRLSVREATKGHDIVRAFLKLGVKPEEHLTLLKVCREVGDPDFVRVAVKLVQIESQTGIPGDELVSRYEQAQARLPVLEANIARRQAELKSVNDELSQNKQALAAQRKEFEQYQKDVKARETEMDTGLAAKMAELAVKKEETEGAAVLKSILSQKGLSLETLIKLAQEFGERKGGKIKEVDSAKLNEALKVFSSLQEANIHLKNQNKSYQQWNQRFKEDYPSQSFQWAALVKKIEGCEATEKDVERRLREKSKELEALGNEYELFCGFMAMVHGSSSVTESTGMLIDLFQHLKDHGWSLSRSPEEMRGLFIRVIMGDHLKSFRCDYCGSKFITNGKPGSKSKGNYYVCPVCHFMSSVKADDSLLKALVPGKRLEDIQLMEELLKENEALKPFQAFLSAPCEFCHQPVTRWGKFSVQQVIEGAGCGHTACWDTDIGRLKMVAKAAEKIRRRESK